MASTSATRVVVTGLGLVCPLGTSVASSWSALLAGKSGVARLEPAPTSSNSSKDDGVTADGKSGVARFGPTPTSSKDGGVTADLYAQIPCRVAAPVRDEQFDWRQFSAAERRQMSRAVAFAVAAGDQALADAGLLDALAEEDGSGGLDREAIGVAVGMGMADLMDIYETGRLLAAGRYSRISPYFVPRILTNMAAGRLSIRHRLRGPNHSVSTACTTGVHSIGDAFNLIRGGKASAMLCGGTDACITPIGLAGFCRLRALSTAFADTPERASRPFDAARDGFVMGEGAGLVVLESLEHALGRGAPHIHAEVVGYGLSGDGFHMTSPDETGAGATLCMRRALDDARLTPADVAYVNAHATSTPQGDRVESVALSSVFGDHHPVVSSCKGAIGHLLGAAGAVEAIMTMLSVRHGVVAPNLNLEETDIHLGVNYAPGDRTVTLEPINGRRVAVKNSFGFGGTNASLCIAEYVG